MRLKYCSAIRISLLRMSLFGLMMLLHFSAFAQNQISGRVTDPNGEAIIGVNVVEKGTTNGTITDFDGNYQFQVSSGATITASFIGYTTEEMVVGNQSKIDFVLQEDVEELEEVIVIGYGVQKKSVVTGSIASIKAEEISATPAPNISQALQGRSPGVTVSNASGQPGAGINVRVRGVGTTGNAQPLYIVDGMQVDDISFLNPTDIESMEVLKDAASGAIYGSRAANGVVLISTKKGQKGRLVLSYDGYMGVQSPWKHADLLGAQDYMMIHNETALNDGKAAHFSPEFMATNQTDTDWQSEIFNKAAMMMNHQFMLSGGNDASTYSASIGYFGQDGIVGPSEKSNFQRFSMRLNSTHQLNKKVKVGQNLTFTNNRSAGIREDDIYFSPLTFALLHDPLTPVIETDKARLEEIKNMSPTAFRNANGEYYGISQHNMRDNVNPVAAIDNTFNAVENRMLIGNFFGDLDITKAFKIHTDFGFDFRNNNIRNYTPEGTYNNDRIYFVNDASNRMTNMFNWQWETYAAYDKAFGGHHLNVVAGTTLQRFTNQWMEGTRTNINPSGWDYAWLNNGADDDTQKVQGMFIESRLMSFFTRANWDYKEKYMLSATVRADGSTRFGSNNRFGYFPSISAGWLISNEKFFSSTTINHLKLRGSWGKVGNQEIGNFRYMSAINQTIPYVIRVC
ncbi:SusC/RagA family TonB-linked outer membrane protein [Persicobacter diffluens]|uniref:TonB-dependent receptor plug domain-containing protein n=1 Tax=Persicobacter diffluens TaxID=981 RepID=A0AAN5ALF6_9BACT|nr:hypothetical protein PEDI_33390 [Persicobacter diffluens]